MALLTNATKSRGHRLSLRLVGVSSSRDAIGATVTARLGKRTIVRQLTAGDGYHGSNERLVIFGLGDSRRVDELHIRWPSGAEMTFSNVPADVELLFIEHRPFQIMRTLPGDHLNPHGPGDDK
ncbi:MAG: ASPIC/UnbV domain-containing protein [Chloroflexi bacterium]|nr:ASPIC/UnbV domain-containing protein [Chloroflexota bacterium]